MLPRLGHLYLEQSGETHSPINHPDEAAKSDTTLCYKISLLSSRCAVPLIVSVWPCLSKDLQNHGNLPADRLVHDRSVGTRNIACKRQRQQGTQLQYQQSPTIACAVSTWSSRLVIRCKAFASKAQMKTESIYSQNWSFPVWGCLRWCRLLFSVYPILQAPKCPQWMS